MRECDGEEAKPFRCESDSDRENDREDDGEGDGDCEGDGEDDGYGVEDVAHQVVSQTD